MFLKWMLTNIPTMGLFASADGDTRVNILDMEICDSVYFDCSMKNLILDRMMEFYKAGSYNRFSSIIWSGYSYLGLNNPHVSVKFVKRGKLSRRAYGEMIFPLTGKQMEGLIEKINALYEDSEAEISRLYDVAIESIIQKVREEDRMSLLNRILRYAKGVELPEAEQEESMENGVSPKVQLDYETVAMSFKTDDELKADGKTEADIERIREGGEKIKKEQLEPMIIRLKSEILQYKKGSECSQILLTNIGANSAYHNLVQYTTREAKIHLPTGQIDTLYKTHILEMQKAILYKMQRSFLNDKSREFKELYGSIGGR